MPALQQDLLRYVSLFAVLCVAPSAIAAELEPLDACGALAVSADVPSGMEEMVMKLTGGHSVRQAVAACNQDKELCQKVRKDFESVKIAVPKELTCSK
jgi:hypothetical protein